MKTRQLQGTPYEVVVQKLHAYNLDTILLANFASTRIKKSKKIVDLGTGNGVLMLYISLYTDAHMVGYDITPDLIDIANRNIKLNHLQHQIEAIEQDVTTLTMIDCDTIITNPPYFKYDSNTNVSTHESRTIARFEISMTIDTILALSSKSLKTKQSLLMIHRSDRLDEIMIKAQHVQLTLKEVQFIHPYQDKPSEVVLLHFIKDGKQALKVLPPMILYDTKHQLSLPLKNIYKGVSNVTEYIKP